MDNKNHTIIAVVIWLLAIAIIASVNCKAASEASPVEITITGPAEVKLWQKAEYAVTVTNNGKTELKDAVIRVKIPPGMKYKDKTDGTALKYVSNLEPQKSNKFSYTVDTIKTGTFTNTAEVYVKDTLFNKASVETRVIGPELKLSIEGPRLIYLHKNGSYTIIIANDGTDSAKEINVTYTVPEHLEYIESSPKGEFTPLDDNTPAIVTWSLPEIQAKKRVEITLTARAKIIGHVSGSVKMITASGEYPAIMPLEANCTTEIIGIPAMQISSYDTEDPVAMGKETTYVIEVRNEGTVSSTNVGLTSVIPPEMEFISAKGPVAFKQESGKVVFESVSILPAGEKLTYKVTCKAIKEGSAKHKAILKYDQFEKEIADEEGTVITK
jgi:uncharacterized repeat protein (TIGR01451 family)